MFYILLIISLISFCQHAKYTQNLHADEKIIALQKFKSLGFNTKDINFSVIEETGELCVLEDNNKQIFIIVAKKKYKEFINNLVLAYSTSNGFQRTESTWKKNLLRYYTIELINLKHNTQNTKRLDGYSFEYVSTFEIKPLIKTIWGQSYPYNLKCPTSIISISNKMTGCVATALSQIMYYHKYPQTGEGRIEVFVEGQLNKMDFSKISPKWEQMKTSYKANPSFDENVSAVADLMFQNAIAVSSSFNNTDTSANNLAARTALVNFWHYHPTCQLIQDKNQGRLIEVIIDNLKRRLPVIISGGSHSFICDGIKDDYLHFNMGWGGDANGYYRVVINSNTNNELRIIKEVLHNIYPDKDNITTRYVQLEKAGTLKDVLTDQEKKNIRSLSICGPLNGKDIALIRRMSGASDAWNNDTKNILQSPYPWIGCLQVLDIENAYFVKDNDNPYYRISASGSSFVYNNNEYVFNDNMDYTLFDRFKRTPLSKGIGYIYSFYDSNYYIEFFTEPYTISPMMFYDCQNLRDIKLPHRTKRIMGKSFKWCNSMTYIKIPDSTNYIESGAFEDCYLLECIYVTRVPKETHHKLSVLKVEGKYGDIVKGRHLGLFFNNSIYTCKGIIMKGERLTSIPYKIQF